jgi:two-component system sensor histidine kinase CiaH
MAEPPPAGLPPEPSPSFAEPGPPAPAPEAGADPTAAREAAEDARLIRRVRWRLVAWSGASTLVVLVVLGVALYLSVASSLQATAVAVLNDRGDDIASLLQGQRPNPGAGPTDFSLVGGTFGIVVGPSGQVVGPRQFALPAGLPDQDAIAAADATGRDIRLRTLAFEGPGAARRAVAVPVRQLTIAVDTLAGRWYVQVIQDRTTEARTLDNIVIVLVLGAIVVVLVAVGFGAIYARRALVPIRDSIAGQRAALRRQREFAADASHELRTPLSVIRASVAHLRRHADQPVSEVGEALEDIDAEVGQLTAMVEDLLLLARSDSGAMTLEQLPLELDDVAADAASGLRTAAEARRVRIVVDPEPTPVMGDPTRLRQLVTVLLDNAIRHSPSGGEVRLTIRGAEPAAVGGADRAPGQASLVVEDQGPGIRAEDLPRIFDRFWRAADAPSGGTGLGLAIAKWIAEGHGGEIRAANRAEGGARFAVRLPIRRTGSAAAPSARPQSPAGAPQAPTGAPQAPAGAPVDPPAR